MERFDFSPLFRSAIGFEKLTDLINNSMRTDPQGQSYPPYNIERLGEEEYRITMAVAGFGEEDINIVAQENSLIVSGKLTQEEERDFLYRGIAGRAFERRFQLADYIRVHSASLKNGLLHIDLVREVPERMKPRQIKISSDEADKPTIIGQAA